MRTTVLSRALSTATLLAAAALGAAACGPPPAARSTEDADSAPRKRICREVEHLRTGAACLGEITAETQSHLGAAYILEEAGGRALSVRCVNGAGGPCAEPEDTTFAYEGGVLTRTAHRSELGVPFGYYVYSNLANGKSLRRWQPLSGEDDTFEHVLWDARGFIAERRYVDAAGEPLADADGVYGIRYTRDEEGRISGSLTVDAGGRPMLNRTSFSGQKYRRDAAGNIVSAARFDVDDRPSRPGIQRTVFEYDAWGNVTKTSNFDADGKPSADTQAGASSTERRDEHGNPVETRYFGVDGGPYLAPSGEAGFRAAYDAAGRRVRIAYLNAAGAPAPVRGGVARIDMRYDPRGRLVEERYYNEGGEPVVAPIGCAILARKYNDAGDEVVTAYLGPHERPMIRKGLYSAVARDHDGAHRLLAVAYLDERGKPVDIWRGYAGVRYTYDASGKRTRTVHVDSSGQPVEMVDLRMLRVAFQGQGLDVPGVTRSRDDARARAAEALARIRGGLGFVAAVRLFADDASSDGGTGEMAATALQPEIAKAVAQLAPGDVSEVLETLGGFFIVQRSK